MSIPKGDITPPGVTLRDFGDHSALRSSVLDSTMTAMQKKFPQEYGNYRLELDDIYYAEQDDYDLDKQKNALMKNDFLSKRLRGKLSLYDKNSGDKIESRELTLMKVPYVTDRGTTIHNGNEYVTLNQARLSSGIYTRKKDSGEIESHINAKRGTGKSFRIRLEPESSLYKLDIDQASLRLYSLLHDLGVSDDELEARWGPEVLEANRAKYDSRILDKAYGKLVRDKKDGASKQEKAEAVREALKLTRISRSSVEKTLPNLFDMKQASEFRKAAFQGQMAQTSEEYVKWDQKRMELEAKAKEKQEKEEFKKDLDARRKSLEIQGLNRDILDETGSVDQPAVVKQLAQNVHNRQKTEKNIKTKKVVKEIKHKGKQEVDKIKSEDKLQDRYHTIKDKAEQERVQQEKDMLVGQFRQDLGLLAPQPEMGMPEQPMMPPKVAHTKESVLGLILRNKKKIMAAHYATRDDDEEMTEEEEAEFEREARELARSELSKEAAIDPGSPLDEMLKAKLDSDRSRYDKKHKRMRNLMMKHPKDFYINVKEGQVYGITHAPTKFRMHLPKHVIADLDLEDRSDVDLKKVALSVLGVKSSASIEGAAFDLDPPNYQAASDELQSCYTCGSNDDATGKCNAFDFSCNPDYVCDAWKEDTVKLASKGNYKQSPMSATRPHHTKTLPNGHEIDILKLEELVKDRTVETIPAGDLSLSGANRSKRTGYGPKRYEDADTSKPVLVDEDNNIIDGRHRYFKSVDEKQNSVDCIRVTGDDISKCYTGNDSPDYNSSSKQ